MGLYDNALKELENEQTNTENTNTETNEGGLYDSVMQELEAEQNKPSEPTIFDKAAQFATQKTADFINNMGNQYVNTPPFGGQIQIPQEPIKPIQQPQAPITNPLTPKTYNDLMPLNSVVNPEPITENIEPIQPQNSIEQRVNTTIMPNRQNIQPNFTDIRNFGEGAEPTQYSTPNYANGYSLDKANELAKQMFPNLQEFTPNNGLTLRGQVYQNDMHVNPDMVAPQNGAYEQRDELENGTTNIIDDENVPYNAPNNYSLGDKQIQNLHQTGLYKFYQNIHSGVGKILEGHEGVKSVIKHAAQAGIGTYRNAYDALYMIGDATNNEFLKNLSLRGYEVADYLQNHIVPEQGSQGLNNFFDHPIRNISNLLADSTPLMSMAIGGTILASGAAAAMSAPVWLANAAGMATGWAINSVLQGDYIEKKQKRETELGRALTSDEIKETLKATGIEKAVVGGLETVGDMLGLDKLTGGVASKGIVSTLKSVITKAAEQAIEEGTTESLQEATSVAAEKYLDINDGGNTKRVMDAGIGGALLGGVMGGAGGVMNGSISQSDRATINNIMSRLNPSNYEQVSELKPEEVGLGLSRRTVYTPKTSYRYKPTLDTSGRDATPKAKLGNQNNAVDLWSPNFTTGEGSDLNYKSAEPQSTKSINAERIRQIAPKTMQLLEDKQGKNSQNNNAILLSDRQSKTSQNNDVIMLNDRQSNNNKELTVGAKYTVAGDNNALTYTGKKSGNFLIFRDNEGTEHRLRADNDFEKLPNDTKDIDFNTKGNQDLSNRLKELGFGTKEVDELFNAFNTLEPTQAYKLGSSMYDRLLQTGKESDFMLAQRFNKLQQEYRKNRLAKVAQQKELEKQKIQELAPNTAKKMQETTEKSSDSEDNELTLQQFNANDLKTDAETFQYKEGGDENGVTDRLKGVQKWSPISSGKVIVYETKDGTQYIADGHQRLGLAKRLMSEGKAKNIKLDGYLYKETDGYTPKDVRIEAAMNNIRQGTGESVDTAKIIRESGGEEHLPEDLPINDKNFRDGVNLSHLTDDNFRRVIDKDIAQPYAAEVGKVIRNNGEKQKIAIDTIIKSKPSTRLAASLIAQDILHSDTRSYEQTNLFGTQVMVDSLAPVKAKIVSKAVSELKSIKGATKNANKNADILEKAQNKINKSNNQTTAERANIAAQLLGEHLFSHNYLQQTANKLTKEVSEGTITERQAIDTLKDLAMDKDILNKRDENIENNENIDYNNKKEVNNDRTQQGNNIRKGGSKSVQHSTNRRGSSESSKTSDKTETKQGISSRNTQSKSVERGVRKTASPQAEAARRVGATKTAEKQELIEQAKGLGIKGDLSQEKTETLKAKIAEVGEQIPLAGMEEQSAEEVRRQRQEVIDKENKEKYSTTQHGTQLSMFNKDQFTDGRQKMLFDTSNVENGYKAPEEKGEPNVQETNGAGNTSGNRESSAKLRGNVQTRQRVVQNKSEMADRNSKGSIRRDGTTRTADTRPIGNERLTPEDKEVIEKEYKNQHELNTAIENYINNKEYEKYKTLPVEVKDWLKKYAGAGGLEKQGAEGKGLLSEYYTPQNVVNKMWDLTAQYVNTDGANVLEPSAGIGRFLENAPKGTNFDIVEMNPVSAKIAELLYPNANVTVGQFQERFINKSNNTPVKSVRPEYDIVIGNPPYGQYSGRYKGLGEGKQHQRLEAYFIDRGLDSLKENGIMTFIVPSSFLNGIISTSKNNISRKSELLDAYRLPEGTFDTTSIGTDIIVLRKTQPKDSDKNQFFGDWFKKHPEKILGNVEQRKNRFGKQEEYVKGDKNAVDNIDTSKKDIKETIEAPKTKVQKTVEKLAPKTAKKMTKKKPVENTQKAEVNYTEYKAENPVSVADYKYYADTRVDGTLPKELYSVGEKVNQYNGELYNDFNYLQGDIYEKLDALEHENISKEQKDLQRKKLLSVLPKRKNLSEIKLTPTSDFVREFKLSAVDSENQTLEDKYVDYINSLSNSERNGVSSYDMRKYLYGERIVKHFNGSDERKEVARTEYLTKLKKAVDKTFNDFLNTELSNEDKINLTEKWNRTFNGLYTPDYTKIPMIVKGLNSMFKGEKLKLQNVQVEGVNYLTNKGVGLLGFEVGVGKTLSGIIATVQNMQMGRCKRPLILVPKQVKPNWIYEINQAFPNIKVNDVDNLGKFKGKIEDNTISVATYQALENIWYGDSTLAELTNATKAISNDYSRESTKRGIEVSNERIEKFIGEAEKGNKKKFNLEDLGFDHITIDEAHNFKNLFSDARADGQQSNAYTKITGGTSTRAKRLFMATQYVLSHNNNRNVFMLTATPFNNSPLEVFNMLTYLAKDKLDKMGIYNVYQFMENYVDISADWVVDSKNDVVFKQIATGFKNLQSLQEIIKSCMLMRSADDADIKRPNKHTKRVVLEPTQEQLDMIAEAEKEAVTAKKDDKGADDKGAVLKAISKTRIATLSPDIYNKNMDVSPEDFIKRSPKLEYVCKAVEAMKNRDENTSQLIYMPIGVDFIPKIKEYLVNKGVYKADEIGIIKAGIKDDEISEMVNSFNSEDGKLKLIIGTNKIKEGMNLNGRSSVLYVPFMDWNPTDYKQLVGRIWRRGNIYDDIRVVVPLLKDSSDPFMFQKLDEKTKRLNNIWDAKTDYIDVNELSTADEKINMITNPDKKANMFSQIEKQKLENEQQKYEGRLETTESYKNDLIYAKGTLKGDQNNLEYYQKKLSNIEDKESYSYESCKSNLDYYKKEVAKDKQKLKSLNERIERLELDLNGKDSEEHLNEQIDKVKAKIEKLEETTEKKRKEYQKEYEKTRAKGKNIDELIKDFDNDTQTLYGGEKHGTIEDNVQNSIEDTEPDNRTNDNITEVQKAIRDNSTVKDVVDMLGLPEEDFVNSLDYTFKEITGNATGSHNGTQKTISINIERIGNNKQLLVETLAHENEHANQYVELQNALNNIDALIYRNKIKQLCDYNYCKKNGYLEHKGNKELNKYLNYSGLSNADKNVIRRARENNIANGQYQEFRNLHKDNLNDIIKQTTEYEISNDKHIVYSDSKSADVQEYCTLREKYLNSKNEVAARRTKEQYKGFINESKQQKNNRPSNIQSNDGRNSQRTIRNRIGDNSGQRNGRERKTAVSKDSGVGEEQFSIDEPGAKKIKEKALDKIYEWHGNIGKDRYDVDKALNSFVNLTKHLAKEYKKKTGMNVTDKMVREVMPFLRERTGLPKSLDRPELKRFFERLQGTDKARLTSLADEVSAKFDKYYKNYEAQNGVEDAEGIENHISHIWDLDKQHKALMTNYFSTSSKFAKTRTIDTLVKGIDGFRVNGELIKFKPKTLDYAEILKASSDSLIKATHDRILAESLKNLKYKGKPLIMATSKAPADWVEVSHPALNKSVYVATTKDDNLIFSKGTVKVHPAIAPQVAAIFEVQKADNAVEKAYDTANGGLKQATLGLSLFHGWALGESGVANMGFRKTLEVFNPVKLLKAVKNNEHQVFGDEATEKLVKNALADGVQIGTPQVDTNRSQVEAAISKIPILGSFLKANNVILWDEVHTMLKVRTYEFLVNQLGGFDKTTKAQRREIAQWVNDSFGGQAWELLGIKKSTVKALGRVFLSPDWNISKIREFFGMFDTKTLERITSGKDEGFWKFVEQTAEGIGARGQHGDKTHTRGKSARKFMLSYLVIATILSNVLNAAFREADRKKHPEYYTRKLKPLDYTIWANSLPNDALPNKVLPYIFIGRNDDGSARYLRLFKAIREVPEMMFEPVNKIAGKSASIINMISQVGLGFSPADIPKVLTGNQEDAYYNQNIWNGYGNYAKRKEGKDLAIGMAKTAGKSVLPFTVNNAIDEKHNSSWWDLVAQTSRGVTYGKAMKQYEATYKKGNNPKDIEKITERAIQDGMPYPKIEAAQKKARQSYESDIVNKYTAKFMEGLKQQNQSKINKVGEELEKKKIPADIAQKAYTKALEKYSLSLQQ